LYHALAYFQPPNAGTMRGIARREDLAVVQDLARGDVPARLGGGEVLVMEAHDAAREAEFLRPLDVAVPELVTSPRLVRYSAQSQSQPWIFRVIQENVGATRTTVGQVGQMLLV
jgi:hypothetical protein